MMPTVGWLGNRLGNRHLFVLCLLLTRIGSTCSGLSWSTSSLVFFRILHGAGAGPLSPLSRAILFETFLANKRGLALGLISANWAIGALISLPLGGYLIEAVGWRASFFAGLPLGALSLGMALVSLPHRAMAAGQDHYGHPFERMYALNEVQTILQRAGEATDVIGVRAQDIFRQHLMQEASVAAFQDCFLLTAMEFISAMFPALFVRPHRREIWRKRG